jgi:AraC-like DNA-binding protein
MELLASAFSQFRAARTHRSSLATMHRMQIVELIEKGLHDPTLTPSGLSAALRITPRYLHRLFSGDGETVSRYILRRRLERAAQELVDPLHSRRHVSDIAFGCGFSTVSHFCRTFREQYGMSPGDFRDRRKP